MKKANTETDIKSRGQGKGLLRKGHGETFWNNGNILYLDCDGGGYMTVYLSKLMYQYTQKDEF